MPPTLTSGSEDGEEIDYAPLSFYPERWAGCDAKMTVFEGEHVVFLALSSRGPYAAPVMRFLLDRLDRGWAVYMELLACAPPRARRPGLAVRGKAALVAAVPEACRTCGYGCGFVGVTGIEVAGFYSRDYPRMCAEARRGELAHFEHYFFYEMGRNYYLFGDRHRAFATGYAVCMRYVLMDLCGCVDYDDETKVRRAIEKCESAFASLTEPKLDFVDAMTSGGKLCERDDRIPGLSPSDQPCMYASVQLYLYREYGGKAFLKRFYCALQALPATLPTLARTQCLAWVVCACAGARSMLTDDFVSRWRFGLRDTELQALAGTDWTSEDPRVSIECVLATGILN